MALTLSSLYEKDLNKLIEEISLYKDETDIWKVKDGIVNSGGNLTLHLLGNLNHFIGAVLGNTGYVRERDKEFSLKNVPRTKLIDDLNNTSTLITGILASLSQADLEKDFPVPINNKISPTGIVLAYLLAHLSYHLGQINYLRRLLG